MERILLLEDDKSLVTGLTAALLAAECAAWAVCPALCLPLLGLFVLLSAGTYAASGLLVGVAAGLVLHRALYTRLITTISASCGGCPSGCWQCSVCSWQVQRRLRCTAR